MFDGITYGKAAAVLLMTENYLGEEPFARACIATCRRTCMAMPPRRTSGIHCRIQRQARRTRSWKSLVTQPGEPLLTFGRVRDGSVEVTQKRFFLNPNADADEQQTWDLAGLHEEQRRSTRLPHPQRRTQHLQAPQAPVFYGNAGGKGYYRSRYDSADYQQLLRSGRDQPHALRADHFPGKPMGAGPRRHRHVGDFLNLAAAVRDDSSSFVIDYGLWPLCASSISRWPLRQRSTRRFAAWVRKNFAPALARLGAPAAGDAAR
jgi:hypothetical protein